MIEIVDIQRFLASSDDIGHALCPLCGNHVVDPGPIHIGVAFGRQAIIHRGCYASRSRRPPVAKGAEKGNDQDG